MNSPEQKVNPEFRPKTKSVDSEKEKKKKKEGMEEHFLHYIEFQASFTFVTSLYLKTKGIGGMIECWLQIHKPKSLA